MISAVAGGKLPRIWREGCLPTGSSLLVATLGRGIRIGMELQGARVSIRPMKKADLDAMMEWRPFSDPLYQPFDFPRQSKAEHVQWFEWRSRDPSRRLYTIEDEKGQVIGSLTLREIDGKRSARLGITIGADYVSQGYGTEALRLFLGHYFEEMGFSRIVLDVAATNLRAVRCYQSLGFRQTGCQYRPAGDPSYRILLRDPHYLHLRRFFRRHGTMSEVLFYDMALAREEWRAQSKRESIHLAAQPLSDVACQP